MLTHLGNRAPNTLSITHQGLPLAVLTGLWMLTTVSSGCGGTGNSNGALDCCGDLDEASGSDAPSELLSDFADVVAPPDSEVDSNRSVLDSVADQEEALGDETGSEPVTMRVMTFNLRTGLADDGPDSWKDRESVVIEFLQQTRPSVFGIQEGLIFQLMAIDDEFPTYSRVGTSRSNNDFDEFCAIYYDTSALLLKDSSTFWLSDTPDVPGSKFSDKQGWPRIVTWARLEEIQSRAEFVVFNTHYDTSDEDNIPARSSKLVIDKINDIASGLPVFLTGDFNTHVGELAYLMLVGQQEWEGASGDLLDGFLMLGLPEQGSFHDFTGVAESTSRIDWVLHRGQFEPTGAEVSHFSVEGHFPSDHFPVWVDYKITP